MSLLCCWPKKSKISQEKYTDDEKSPSPQRKSDLGPPSKTKMASDALLTALQVAENIPIPAVGAAVKAAIRLIEMCQQARASLEQADELSKRIRGLSLVMVQGLSGKPLDEISEDLKRDIEQLQDNLHHIEQTLQEISGQHRLVIFLFRKANGEAVNKCLTRLDGSLVNFELSRQIHSDTVLRRIENDIEAHYKMLDATWKNTEEIKAVLARFMPEFSQNLKPTSQTPQFPPRSRVFHGRDELVERLATKLTPVLRESDNGLLVALLGPGGMGKTSVGLAVMEHPVIVKRYGQSNRFWIPCVKAESVTLFLDIIYDSLCISRKTGKTLDDILTELESPGGKLHLQPNRVLLLDNFETPWNLGSQERAEVEVILRSLMRIPRVSILITMRANQPPTEECEEEWITPLDREASARIYKDIYPKTSKEQLDELLDAVGHLPLAVTLIAKYAQTNGATPAKLLEAWRREGTGILSLGNDDTDNMINRSIKLSIDSPRMKKSPDSLKMLVFLALFPAGIATTLLPQWLPSSINSLKTLSVLSSAALIEQRDETVIVIPVIRSYVLQPSHTSPEILRDAQDHARRVCCSLLAQHRSEPGDIAFPEDKEFIYSQECNLQTILLDTIPHIDTYASSEVLEALLTVSKHQRWTRPRLDLIQHTLFVAEHVHNDKYIAESLACRGEIYLELGRYDNAIESLVLAHDKFFALKDNASAARCLLRRIYCKTYKDASFQENLSLVLQAQSEYDQDDVFGQALCMLYLGMIYWQGGDRHRTIPILQQAKATFEQLEKPYEVAKSLYYMSRTYHDFRNDPGFPPDSLSISLRLENEALELYTKCDCGDDIAVNLWVLAEILKDMQSYDDALRRALQALEMWKSLGSPNGVTIALLRCGEILTEMEDYEAAQDAIEKGIVSLEALDDSFQKQMVKGHGQDLLAQVVKRRQVQT
ncbi:hypothetical protein VKT23_018187 [Stygiomarasmius scandens]|uniref:Novel STAND NTPase 1 domain-containing protein n=1 Tax=Marasmiellus scandens TaxID=2682957 RepID=A0ABR1IRR4_9AGAR